jgi:hypothetical protein
MSWRKVGLSVVALALGTLGPGQAAPCWAQFGPILGPADEGLIEKVSAAVPPQGDWVEVLTVKGKWLVVQNQRGQQFPIDLDNVGLFMVRWPINLASVPPEDLADVYGLDLNNNNMAADHVDVYEPDTAVQLGLQPTYISLARLGMLANNWQLQVNLQWNLFQPMFGVGSGPIVANGQPPWMHVVGPVVAVAPVQVLTPGNIVVTIVPAMRALSATLVRIGTPSYVSRGDWAYIIPAEITPKSLNLAQLIIYKKGPPGPR